MGIRVRPKSRRTHELLSGDTESTLFYLILNSRAPGIEVRLANIEFGNIFCNQWLACLTKDRNHPALFAVARRFPRALNEPALDSL